MSSEIVPGPTSADVLAATAQQLLQHTAALNSELRDLRRRKFRDYFISVVIVLLVLSVGALILLQNNWVHNRSNDSHRLLDQITSCTSPTGSCYQELSKQGQLSTALAIRIGAQCYSSSATVQAYLICLEASLGQQSPPK